MTTPNICFHREISKIFCGYPLLSGAILLNVGVILTILGFIVDSTRDKRLVQTNPFVSSDKPIQLFYFFVLWTSFMHF